MMILLSGKRYWVDIEACKCNMGVGCDLIKIDGGCS
jgi:hypothetical protein